MLRHKTTKAGIPLDNEFHRLLFDSAGKAQAYEFMQAEMVMVRHLTRHLSEKEELEKCCPEYFKL